MSSVERPRQRRRNVLTCVECRKRKQKCDRRLPCTQCVVRGTDGICKYGEFKNLTAVSPQSNKSSSSEIVARKENSEAPALFRHAHDYGYSNVDSLSSMGMLTKVITGIDSDIKLSHPIAVLQIQNRVRSEYHGYVRRLPSKMHCELLFRQFFAGINHLNMPLDQTIFQEQLTRWWNLAYDILLKYGHEKLPEDLQHFPALMFQVLAVALQFQTPSYDHRLDELKFGGSQTFTELSVEYSDCGVAISKLLGRSKPTFVAVQHSLMKDFWLVNTGDLMQSWNHSGQTVKDAMAIGLHLEPEVPSTSQADALLDTLWMNELRKRTWLNLFVWDNFMALALGRPMFINPRKCTVTLPIDCEIPIDRLKRIPLARSHSDRPTPMTERLLRAKMAQRLIEIRELEGEGPVPQDHEKVKELHHFAVDFRNALPAYFRTTNPDTSWDSECPFVPIHRELISFMIDAFQMALHRPYIFTREKSQRQIYQSSLAILDSQDRLFETIQTSQTHFYIGLTFPTFDAAILLAIVLVSNPERYHTSFHRAHQGLQSAFERLTFIGTTLPLAKTGAEILQTTLRRVIEAQERVGYPVCSPSSDPNPSQAQTSLGLEQHNQDNSSPHANSSPDNDRWWFDGNQSAMEWTTKNPDYSDFDFSNLEVPMPLKELFLEDEMATLQDMYFSEPAMWMPTQNEQEQMYSADQQPMMDAGENSLWNFLTGYPAAAEAGPES